MAAGEIGAWSECGGVIESGSGRVEGRRVWPPSAEYRINGRSVLFVGALIINSQCVVVLAYSEGGCCESFLKNENEYSISPTRG